MNRIPDLVAAVTVVAMAAALVAAVTVDETAVDSVAASVVAPEAVVDANGRRQFQNQKDSSNGISSYSAIISQTLKDKSCINT